MGFIGIQRGEDAILASEGAGVCKEARMQERGASPAVGSGTLDAAPTGLGRGRGRFSIQMPPLRG